MARRKAPPSTGACVDDDYLRRLRSVAQGRRAVASVVCDKPVAEMYGESISLTEAPTSLTPAARAAWVEDLAALEPTALVRSFPRDENGFVLGETVLLATYESLAPIPRGKRPWLVARGPLKRSHPNVVALLFDVIDAAQFPLQWITQRHLWMRGVRATPRLDLALPLLDAEERDARIEKLARSSDPRERAARSILLLDAGRIAEALGVYAIELDPALHEVLAGHPREAFQRIYGAGHWENAAQFATFAEADAKRWAERWRATFRAQMHRLAPWLLHEAPIAAPRRGGPGKARLFQLPYGPAAKRPGVFLVENERGRTIELQYSAVSGHLAEHFWARPIELDLQRFGLD